MKKKIQKPFDVETAKNGAKIETKSGHPVRIVCYDRKGSSHPILALVNRGGTEELCFSYNFRGERLYDGLEDNLVIVEEVEVAKFKEDDYIVLNQKVTSLYYIYKVYYIDTMYHTYHLVDINNNSFIRPNIEEVDKSYHKWTLDDAKPGDVLIRKDGKRPFIFKALNSKDYPIAYCGIDSTNSIFISENYWTTSSVRPATHEERQQLFNRLEEEGYKWDAESLTLTKIPKRWRDNESAKINGYFIDSGSSIVSHSGWNSSINHNVFATEKQAKSALAMSSISQIIANDERFGGVVTDNEWDSAIPYFVIIKVHNMLVITRSHRYEYLAFHSMEQANLFLEENEDLVKDYYMLG